jgi:hypothetical protein
MEKASYLRGLIAKPAWPFIPARESGAFWLFHVIEGTSEPECQAHSPSFYHQRTLGVEDKHPRHMSCLLHWGAFCLDSQAQIPYSSPHKKEFLVTSPCPGVRLMILFQIRLSLGVAPIEPK